jgi:hypothetical protein
MATKKTTTLGTMSGERGTILVSGTDAVTRDFSTIVVHADAVIAELYYSGALSTNIIADLGLSGITLNQFEAIFCRQDKVFGKIKLTSGSVFTQ